jgi:hypothetical protein
MARKPRLSKGIVMRPNFFVFCEGDTEVKYVELLRSHFRQPIHIIAKKTLLNITPELVERCKATYIQTKDDHTFLMYDLDVPTMLERLKKISDATLLCSNPCFEIWLLLHAKDQKTPITSETLIKELKKSAPVWKNYTKASFTETQKSFLMSNMDTAVERARNLHESKNPSTGIYKLINLLKGQIKEPTSK